MISTNHHWCAQLTVFHHFVEGQPRLVTITQTDPANSRRKPLEGNTLLRHIEPVVQMGILREQFLHLGIGLTNVFGITR